MGFNYPQGRAPWEIEAAERRARINAAHETDRRVEARRMALADKITMAVVDEIANAIIRPGPKPEERECYVMAQELRDHAPGIKSLVAAILAVEAEDRP